MEAVGFVELLAGNPPIVAALAVSVEVWGA